MTTPLDALEAYLGERYSADTKRNFLGQADRYLRVIDNAPTLAWTREVVMAYVDSMLRRGMSRESVQTNLGGVRALFRAMHVVWPMNPRELHIGAQAAEQGGITLTNAEIALLVHGAKIEAQHSNVGKAACAVVALTNLYGLRGIEVTHVLAAGLDGEELAAQTAKGGRMRRHTIPDAVKPYLTMKARGITRDGLQSMFPRLMKRYVRESRKGEGWHALRRSLVTGLTENGLHIFDLYRWMGWTMTDTAFKYHVPKTGELEARVWAAHPYLSLWEA